MQLGMLSWEDVSKKTTCSVESMRPQMNRYLASDLFLAELNDTEILNISSIYLQNYI